MGKGHPNSGPQLPDQACYGALAVSRCDCSLPSACGAWKMRKLSLVQKISLSLRTAAHRWMHHSHEPREPRAGSTRRSRCGICCLSEELGRKGSCRRWAGQWPDSLAADEGGIWHPRSSARFRAKTEALPSFPPYQPCNFTLTA